MTAVLPYVAMQSEYVHPAGPEVSRVPGEWRAKRRGFNRKMVPGQLGAHARWHKDKPSADCDYCAGKAVPTYTRHDGTVVPLIFEGTRHCVGGCDRELPLSVEYFRTDNRRPGGLGYTCRDCHNRRNRQYRKAHPEKARERNRRHTAARVRRRAREEEEARKALPPELRWLVSVLNRKQLEQVLAVMCR